MRNGRTDAIVN